MLWKVLLVLAVVLTAAAPALAADKAPEQYIKVDMVGTLKSGIFAIGGETTGVQITAKGVTWEVALGKDAAKAEKLDGKLVAIKGMLASKEGVTIPRRTILTAASCDAAGEKDKEALKVEIKGTLQTGLVAAGGATTGTGITAAGLSWELDVPKDKQELAEKLNKKPALVTGTLEMKKPVAAPPRPRFIVTVESLKAVEEKT